MARQFELTTPYGARYFIHGDGAIERADTDEGAGVSGQWHMIGIVKTGPGWAFGTGLIPLARLDPDAIDWRYKNGRPRWTVRDRDHGTMRTWGNTAYHGIATMRRVG